MDLVKQMRVFESDHEPDGWPAIQMRQASALCDEIERLQSIVDEKKSVDRDTIINVLLSIGNMSEGIIADAIISAIGAQQSPAVAVPDEHPWRESMNSNHRSYAEGFNACRAKVLNSNQSTQRVTEQDDRLALLVVQAILNDGGPHESVLESARRIVKVIAANLAGRVTEQDAREILEGFCKFGHYLSEIDAFLGDSDCRALLAKLNDKSDMAPSDELIKEMAKNVADNLIAEFCLVDLSGSVDISDYINCKSVAQSMRQALAKLSEANYEKAN